MAYSLVECDEFVDGLLAYSTDDRVHKAWGRLELELRTDPFRASEAHKINKTPAGQQLWSSKLDRARRVVWTEASGRVLLLLVGEHDPTYQRARALRHVDHDSGRIVYSVETRDEQPSRVRRRAPEGCFAFLTDPELRSLGLDDSAVTLVRAVQEPDGLLDLEARLTLPVVVALDDLLRGARLGDVLRDLHRDLPAEELDERIRQVAQTAAAALESGLAEKVRQAEQLTSERLAGFEQRMAVLAANAEQAQRESEARRLEVESNLRREREERAALERDLVQSRDAARRAEAEARAAADDAAAERVRRQQAAADAERAVRRAAEQDTRRAAAQADDAARAAQQKTLDAARRAQEAKAARAAKAAAKRAAEKAREAEAVEAARRSVAALREAAERLQQLSARRNPPPPPTAGSADLVPGARWTGATTGRPYSLLVARPDIIERTGDTRLSSLLGPAGARAVAVRLLQGRPEGGRITVTRDGHVLCGRAGGGWTWVGQVTSDEWFPGRVEHRLSPPRSGLQSAPAPVAAPQRPSRAAASGNVPSIVKTLWRADLETVPHSRFNESGWTFHGFLHVPCPECSTALAEIRRPMTGGNRAKRYWALYCTACRECMTSSDIDVDAWQHRKSRYRL